MIWTYTFFIGHFTFMYWCNTRFCTPVSQNSDCTVYISIYICTVTAIETENYNNTRVSVQIQGWTRPTSTTDICDSLKWKWVWTPQAPMVDLNWMSHWRINRPLALPSLSNATYQHIKMLMWFSLLIKINNKITIIHITQTKQYWNSETSESERKSNWNTVSFLLLLQVITKMNGKVGNHYLIQYPRVWNWYYRSVIN